MSGNVAVPTGVDRVKEVLWVMRKATQLQDPMAMMEFVLDSMIRMFGGERGAMVVEEEIGRRTMITRCHQNGSRETRDFRISQSVLKHVLGTGAPMISTEAEMDARLSAFDTVHALQLRSIACLPLKRAGKAFGVIYLDASQRRSSFSEDDLPFLEALADQVVIALTSIRLYRDVISDGLTGLASHRYFDLRLSEEIARAARVSRPLALLMLDIDHFKRVNDLQGHAVGNSVLKSVSACLRASIREGDVPARSAAKRLGQRLAGRYGGDEFEVLLPDTGEQGAAVVAERLLRAVRGLQFGANRSVRVTVSIGGAIYPADARDPERLARVADEALYQAKRCGRDQFALLARGAHAPGGEPSEGVGAAAQAARDAVSLR